MPSAPCRQYFEALSLPPVSAIVVVVVLNRVLLPVIAAQERKTIVVEEVSAFPLRSVD